MCFKYLKKKKKACSKEFLCDLSYGQARIIMMILICEVFVLCFHRRFVGWPWVHHLAHFQASPLPVWRSCVLYPSGGSNPAGQLLPTHFLWTERTRWNRSKSAISWITGCHSAWTLLTVFCFFSHSAQLRKVPGLERAAVQLNPSVKRTTYTGIFGVTLPNIGISLQV